MRFMRSNYFIEVKKIDSIREGSYQKEPQAI